MVCQTVQLNVIYGKLPGRCKQFPPVEGSLLWDEPKKIKNKKTKHTNIHKKNQKSHCNRDIYIAMRVWLNMCERSP